MFECPIQYRTGQVCAGLIIYEFGLRLTFSVANITNLTRLLTFFHEFKYL